MRTIIFFLCLISGQSWAGFVYFNKSNSPLDSVAIRLVGCSRDSTVYAFSGNALFAYKGDSWDKIMIIRNDTLPSPVHPILVNDSIIYTTINYIYNAEGIYGINLNNRLITHFTKKNSCIDAQCVNLLGIDKEKHLVLSTDSLVMFTPLAKSIWRFGSANGTSISSGPLAGTRELRVAAYSVDGNGGEWFATACVSDVDMCMPIGGIYKVENNALVLKHAVLILNPASMICKDSILYIGHAGGLFIYNSKNDSLVERRIGSVSAMLLDNHNRIWISTYGIGARGTFSIAGKDTSFVLPGVTSWRMIEDVQHRVWIERDDGGLAVYTDDSKIFGSVNQSSMRTKSNRDGKISITPSGRFISPSIDNRTRQPVSKQSGKFSVRLQ